MSEWPVANGKQPVRVRQPSHLRHELHADSISDDNPGEESTAHAPSSEVVVVETHLHDPEVSNELDVRCNAGLSDQLSLSPRSADLIARTQVSKPEDAATNVQLYGLLRKPSPGHGASPPTLFSYKPARQTMPKSPQKDEVATPQTSITPLLMDPFRNLHDGMSKESAVDDHPDTLPIPIRGEGLADVKMEQSTLPQVEQDPDTSHVTTGVKEIITHDNDVKINQISLTDPTAVQKPSRLKHPMDSKGPPRRKGKKGRKLRLDHSNKQLWPPKIRYTDTNHGRIALLPDAEQPILDIVPPVLDDTTATDYGKSTVIDGKKGILPEPIAFPAEPSLEEQEKAAGHSAGLPEEQVSVYPRDGPFRSSPPPASSRDCVRHQNTPRNVTKRTGYGVRQPREFGRVLHGISVRSRPGRIDKTPPPDGTSRMTSVRPYADTSAVKLSSEHEAFLEFMTQSLFASERKAREQVDSAARANESNLAFLEDTIQHQRKEIEGLESDKCMLQGNIQKLRKRGTTLDKYVKGMEGDFEKVKDEAKAYYKDCNVILQCKVDELQNDKEALHQDFLTTLESLEKSQRKMKTVMEESYTQLSLSELKKADLASQLSTLSVVYDEEKKRRIELEQRIMPALSSAQGGLQNSTDILSDQIGRIEECLHDTPTGDEQNACLKQCIKAIKSREAMPAFTSKDLEKAEGMLRFVCERVETKLEALSYHPFMDEMKKYINHQLQGLREEVLKYDEAVTGHRESQHMNNLLNEQMKFRKEQCAKLEEQVKEFRRTESELKLQYSQLDRELGDLKVVTRDHDSETSATEGAMINLRVQVQKAEDELQTKIAELSHANDRLAERESEITKAKQLEEQHKTKIIQQSRQLRQSRNNQPSSNVLEIQKIEKQYQKMIQEKEVALNNDMHRLQCEREEKEAMITTLQRDLDATRSRLQLAQESVRNANSELESTDLANLEEQLTQKTNAIQRKEEDINTLQKQVIDFEAEAAKRQDEMDQLRSLSDETQSKVDALKKELQTEVNMKVENVANLKEAQDRLESSQNMISNLKTIADEYRSRIAHFQDAQTRHATEAEALRTEMNKLQISLEVKEKELKRLQIDTEERFSKTKDIHETEIEELRCRLSQAEAATTKELHRREISKEDEQLHVMKRQQDAEHSGHAVSQLNHDTLDSSQRIAASELVSPECIPNMHSGKARKKISRQNHSVLSIVGASNSRYIPASAQPNNSRTRHEDCDGNSVILRQISPNPADSLGDREQLDENGVSAIEPSAGSAAENQESLAMTFDRFNLDMSQVAGVEQDLSSSSQLSDVSSELLDVLEMECGAAPAVASQSQDHPKSQANTGSRMMPPPASQSSRTMNSGSREHNQLSASANTSGVQLTRKLGRIPSSPDYVHRPSSGVKTYRNYSEKVATPSRKQRGEASQEPDKNSIQKRKRSESYFDSTHAKRQRKSSKLLSSSPYSRSSQLKKPEAPRHLTASPCRQIDHSGPAQGSSLKPSKTKSGSRRRVAL